MRQNRSVPDVQKSWRGHISENDAEHLVFLDESGANTGMIRHYARAKKNKRAVDRTPVTTLFTTTILFSVQLNGKICHTIYHSGTTQGRFAEYLKTLLIPTLSKTDIIVMDTMRSHHDKVVKQVLDESGISYLYLPTYSPDLNPSEKMWSKPKAYF